MLIFTGVAALVLLAVVVLLVVLFRRSVARGAETTRELAHLRERFSSVVDADAEAARVREEAEVERAQIVTEIGAARLTWEADERELNARHSRALAELETLSRRLDELRAEVNALDEEANLQSFGFYKPRYDFATSEGYQQRLEEVRDAQKRLIKEKQAAVGLTEWTVNGSAAEGRKQINQTLKLILRAFNGECDAALAKVKYNNIGVMEQRIRKSYEAINSLVQVQNCQITRAYLDLKVDELQLAHEYQEKLQAEKEEQRRIRDQMREEEIARRELEKARQDAEKEEQRYRNALEKARAEVQRAIGEKHQRLQAQIEELERRLAEAQERKERAISRAQLTRSGHIYVISNLGSFGEHVYKIGMTRRLDPMDRIRELGDASVPFHFDVHAIIYSEDAPTLENTLHNLLDSRRVNRVNERKEFFRVPIEEIAAAVHEHHGEVELTLIAEAEEYRKTVALVEAEQARSASPAIDAVPMPTP